jgi:putative ABC transport system permease protein
MSFLLETIRLGLSNLRLRMLRSFLTALGIILGVAAVIIMSSLGEGKKRQALDSIDRLGARNIIVRSQKPPESQGQQGGQQRGFISRFGILRADVDVIRENFPDATHIVPLKEVGAQILRQAQRQNSQAYGTTPDLLKVARLTVARGRYLNQQDITTSATVMVIGAEVAKAFFRLEDPLGQTLRIDAKPFVIVGVLAPVGLSGGSGAALIGRDLNLDCHIPITTAREALGDTVFRRESGSFQARNVEVSELYIESPSRERVIADAERVKRIMNVRHADQKDFTTIVPYELLDTAKKEALAYNLVFGAIAGISLLVGGIGIMNIMLASVTERTREIGIRRAIGATRKHILYQFLVETSVLSMIGGLIGVGIGIGGSLLVAWAFPKLPDLPWIGDFFSRQASLPTQLTLWSIILSFVVATVTGLVFGLYPARRAARQDPIVALRHD